MPGFPLEIIGARSSADRVRVDKPVIYLNSLDQFARLLDVDPRLVTFEHAIQEPDNETVRQQNERAHQAWPVPEMANFNWN